MKARAIFVTLPALIALSPGISLAQELQLKVLPSPPLPQAPSKQQPNKPRAKIQKVIGASVTLCKLKVTCPGDDTRTISEAYTECNEKPYKWAGCDYFVTNPKKVDFETQVAAVSQDRPKVNSASELKRPAFLDDPAQAFVARRAESFALLHREVIKKPAEPLLEWQGLSQANMGYASTNYFKNRLLKTYGVIKHSEKHDYEITASLIHRKLKQIEVEEPLPQNATASEVRAAAQTTIKVKKWINHYWSGEAFSDIQSKCVEKQQSAWSSRFNSEHDFELLTEFLGVKKVNISLMDESSVSSRTVRSRVGLRQRANGQLDVQVSLRGGECRYLDADGVGRELEQMIEKTAMNRLEKSKGKDALARAFLRRQVKHTVAQAIQGEALPEKKGRLYAVSMVQAGDDATEGAGTLTVVPAQDTLDPAVRVGTAQ